MIRYLKYTSVFFEKTNYKICTTTLSYPFTWVPAFAMIILIIPLIGFFLTWNYISNYGIQCSEVSCFILLTLLSGFSITAGYHRYFTHKSYECHPWVQVFFLIFGASSHQLSALDWAYRHRLHHRYVDQDLDPYNIKKGFFWSHYNWILFSVPLKKLEDYPFVQDLKKNPRVMWQHRYYQWIGLASTFVVSALIGLYSHRVLGALLWGGPIRIFFVHQMTFFVNSWGHTFGKQPYSQENTSRDSALLGLLTLGEGYHNYHHTYPYDYRNGVQWYDLDPTKWLIQFLKKVGLAWSLRTKLTPL